MAERALGRRGRRGWIPTELHLIGSSVCQGLNLKAESPGGQYFKLTDERSENVVEP